MKQGWMLWIAIAGFAGLGIAVGLAQDTITKDVIRIETPQKVSKGSPTEVMFYHKKHVDQRKATCDKCHPPIKAVVDAPENNQQLVHDACRVCHDKDKPAKTFACQTCHVSKT